MAYADEVLADNPWLYWKLDETSGTAATDSSGNGRGGTYSGAPTFAQAALINTGMSVLFTGDSQFCLSSSAIFNSSTATIECWFDYDGVILPGYTMVAGCNEGNGGGAGDKILSIDDAGHADLYVYDGAPKHVVGATILTSGRYHLVGVIDDAANIARLYVNGVLDGSLSVAESFAGYTEPNVMIGGHSVAIAGGYPDSKTGRRDEFALYTTALSDARILAHYQAGQARATDVPVAHYGMGMGRW